MKTRRLSLSAIALLTSLLTVVVLTGCGSPRDVRKEFEPYVLSRAGEHQIYVATEDTPWKQDVITALSVELGDEYRMTVENLQTLDQIDVDEWDVVIVLSTFYAFGLQSDTADFLDELNQKERVILMVTSAISDLDDYGVDAVTAASVGDTDEDARSLTPKQEPGDVALQLAELVLARTGER